MRRSCDAIATAAAASHRSWASMNCSSSSRSSALGSPADQSTRWDGRCSCIVGPGPLQRAVGRRDARVEERRGLGGRPAEHVAEDQRGPLAGRQHLQGGQERQLDRLALDDDGVGLVVGRRDLVEQPVGVGLQPRHLGERPEVGDAARPAPDHVEADVGGDAVEPGPEHRVAVEACRGPATPAGTSPAPRPRPRRTTPACGSSGRAARAGGAAPGAAKAGSSSSTAPLMPAEASRRTSWTSQPLPSGSLKVTNEP